MNIQLKLVRQINDALICPFNCDNNMYTSVWFEPNKGKFLFQDLYIDYDAIIRLIDAKILIYKSFSLHQNIMMLEYKLNK